jgi:radical SAM-linked protein
VRAHFVSAMEVAEIALGDGKRPLILGPTLPTGATSEAEIIAVELATPSDPRAVRDRLNVHLPDGLRIEAAWIAAPGSPDENPARYDEAEYLLIWQGAPTASELFARLRALLASHEVVITRTREKRTQTLNARALLRDVHLLGVHGGNARLRVTVAVGSDGSLRPDEIIPALGYPADPSAVTAHRTALRLRAWADKPDWRQWQRQAQD